MTAAALFDAPAGEWLSTVTGMLASPVRVGSPEWPPGDTARRARRWAAAGWRPIPLAANGLPITGWADKRTRPPEDLLDTRDGNGRPAWARASGVGIIAGQGLAVLDVDDFFKARQALAAAGLPPTAMVWSPSAKPGKPRAHLWYRHDNDLPSFDCRAAGFEIKAAGDLLRAPWSRAKGGVYRPAASIPGFAEAGEALAALGAAHPNPAGYDNRPDAPAGSDGWRSPGLRGMTADDCGWGDDG